MVKVNRGVPPVTPTPPLHADRQWREALDRVKGLTSTPTPKVERRGRRISTAPSPKPEARPPLTSDGLLLALIVGGGVTGLCVQLAGWYATFGLGAIGGLVFVAYRYIR